MSRAESREKAEGKRWDKRELREEKLKTLGARRILRTGRL